MAALSGYFEIYNKIFSGGLRVDEDGNASLVLGGGAGLSNGYALPATGTAVLSKDGWVFEGSAVDGEKTAGGWP